MVAETALLPLHLGSAPREGGQAGSSVHRVLGGPSGQTARCGRPDDGVGLVETAPPRPDASAYGTVSNILAAKEITLGIDEAGLGWAWSSAASVCRCPVRLVFASEGSSQAQRRLRTSFPSARIGSAASVVHREHTDVYVASVRASPEDQGKQLRHSANWSPVEDHILAHKPRIFLLEASPATLSPPNAGAEIVDVLRSKFPAYEVQALLLDARDSGLPVARRRWLLAGRRRDAVVAEVPLDLCSLSCLPLGAVLDADACAPAASYTSTRVRHVCKAAQESLRLLGVPQSMEHCVDGSAGPGFRAPPQTWLPSPVRGAPKRILLGVLSGLSSAANCCEPWAEDDSPPATSDSGG